MVMETLTAFIRDRSTILHDDTQAVLPFYKGESRVYAVLQTDVTAGLAVIRNRRADATEQERIEGFSINLSFCDLRGVFFDHTNLEGAYFIHSWLDNAFFTSANLKHAKFEGARAIHAHFIGSDLERAVFWSANLKDASFAGAKLNGAYFRGGMRVSDADVSGVDFTAAKGNHETELPASVERPSHWLGAQEA